MSFITHQIRKKKRNEKAFASKMNEANESIHKTNALTFFLNYLLGEIAEETARSRVILINDSLSSETIYVKR